MRIALVLFLLSFVGCKPKKPWTKDALVNDCLRDMNERNEKEKRFTGMQIPYLCGCLSEKFVTTYKSEAESDKDKAGVEKIASDCMTEVMSK